MSVSLTRGRGVVIHVGGDVPVEAIYVGSQAVKKIYLGSELVWRAPVLFDAVGAGGRATSGIGAGGVSFSFLHTASGEDRAVVVGLARWWVVNPTSTDVSVSYGGQDMSPLEPMGLGVPSGGAGHTQQFVLLSPPTGPQAVEVSVSTPGSVVTYAIANSASYTNVGSYTQAESSSGTGTSRSLTVTAASAGDMIVQTFGQDNSILAMSNYNQARRIATPDDSPGLLIGDSPGGSGSIDFTATGSNLTWSGVSVVLHPK